MSRIIVVFALFAALAFASCKKTGSPKSCFTFSKEKVKVGDTLYLLNCSEYYEKFMWTYPGSMLDSFNRHSFLVPAATGTFEVKLVVGDYAFKSTNELKKSFTVE